MSETASTRLFRIAVGSKNPVKLSSSTNGARHALQAYLAGCDVESSGFDVASGVSSQPLGDRETKSGAKQRSLEAYEAYKAANEGRSPDFAIGLEGGVSDENGEMECMAWIVVYDGENYGSSKTGTFTLPKRIRELVLSGMELGDADDLVFGSVNSKQKGGTVGHLTRGVIDRSKYYESTVVMAFIPLLWSDLYP